jgi:2-polyprenyl-6-hydroxyphenyl methylase/3-demethylubiquinone-9 3-methyltransferase
MDDIHLSELKPTGFAHADARPCHANAYLMPAVRAALDRVDWHGGPRRVFDLGCGNGATAAELTRDGYELVGVDPSESGLRIARKAYPHLQLHPGSAYDDLAGKYGRFPAVISLEVVEHLFYPRKFAACVFDLLEPAGVAVISTPYHGYFKNLALALAGKMDRHFSALWDCGHIKFWSMKTLGQLLREAGFGEVGWVRVGRIPPLAKSMIALARRPPQS